MEFCVFFLTLLHVKKVKVLLYPMPPFFLLFGGFPGFTHLSFWYKQHVYDDEYGAMVK
jgi:hypothetical protein